MSNMKKIRAKKTSAKAAAARKPSASANDSAKTPPPPEKEMAQAIRLSQEVLESGGTQMGAIMESGNILIKGFDELARTCAALIQETAGKNIEAARSLMASGTIAEYAEANNRWARQSFDNLMEGTARLSEMSIRMAGAAFEPINDHLNRSIGQAARKTAARQGQDFA